MVFCAHLTCPVADITTLFYVVDKSDLYSLEIQIYLPEPGERAG